MFVCSGMSLTGPVVFVCSGMSLTGPVLCFLWWNESYWSCSVCL